MSLGLTGPQKAATLLLQLGKDRAARVLSQLSEQEIEELTAEILHLERIDPEVAGEVLDEFWEATNTGPSFGGGMGLAQRLLEASLGTERAAGMMERLQTTLAGQPFEFLQQADARQVVSLLSGAGVTAHFANSPFQEQELQDPKIHRVLSSYAVLGGPTTLNSVYATKKFHDNNPKTYLAVLGSLKEAMQFINSDKRRAAEIYLKEERSKLSVEFVQRILEDPDFIVTSEPKGIMKYAEFMHSVKKLKHLPKSAQDVYFPELYQSK